MNWLAIDTSTDMASVALLFQGELTELEQGNQRTHAQFLLPMIEKLLAESQVGLNQLDAIVFSRGPGSFTGLRIGCATAKGLAAASDLELIPVSTLATIAYSARSITHEAPVLAILDARMNEIYWSFIDVGQWDGLEQVSPAERIEFMGEKNIILAGVGIEQYQPLLSDAVKSRIHATLDIYPKASAMIQLAQAAKIKSIPAATAEPVYVRNKVTQGG